MTDPTARAIRKIVADEYQIALDAGEHFTLDDVTGRVITALGDLGDGRDIVSEITAMVARREVDLVDRERRRAADTPALIDDLDRPIAVADSERIARRRMTAADWAAHLAHVGENAARVNASAARENARFAALSPYLSQGLDTETALAAWQSDNPDGVLP